MTKYIRLEVDGVSEKPDDTTLDELRARMLAAIHEQIQDDGPERRKAIEQTERVLEALRQGGALFASTSSILHVLEECISTLRALPHAVRRIAQNLDRPSHIFDLGGAYNELLMATALLGTVKEALEGLQNCAHCKGEAEPKSQDPKVGQA